MSEIQVSQTRLLITGDHERETQVAQIALQVHASGAAPNMRVANAALRIHATATSPTAVALMSLRLLGSWTERRQPMITIKKISHLTP